MSGSETAREFDDGLLGYMLDVVQPGDEIETLTSKRPNKIVSIDLTGIWVETLRSQERGTGAQLVPAWMVMVAWDHLRRNGQLSQKELLDALNVKRSAFVCALLARFPDVSVSSRRPTVLEFLR